MDMKKDVMLCSLKSIHVYSTIIIHFSIIIAECLSLLHINDVCFDIDKTLVNTAYLGNS